jgi:AraC-like DNA-binding protein
MHFSEHFSGCATRFHKQVECLFVLEGEMEVSLDGESYRLREGDLYLMFPNLLHARSPADAKFYCLIANGEIFSAYADVLAHQKPACPVLRKNELPACVPFLLKELYRIQKSEEHTYTPAVTAGFLNALLGELLGSFSMVPRDSDNDLVQRLMLFIYQNYTREITLDDVARNLNYSKYYISHIIAETFHCNFRPLINSYRISMAQHLLLSTPKSVNAIASECGFRNQSSFNRIFRDLCGVTPTAYRKAPEDVADRPAMTVR